MIQSLDTILDDAAMRAKQNKLFDLSVISDVIQRTESERFGGKIYALKVTGAEGSRTLTLGCDSATALLIAHDLSGILARINPLLGGLAVDRLRIEHYQKSEEHKDKERS